MLLSVYGQTLRHLEPRRENNDNVVVVGDDKASCEISGSCPCSPTHRRLSIWQGVVSTLTMGRLEKFHFDYDAVVGPDSTQEDVYDHDHLGGSENYSATPSGVPSAKGGHSHNEAAGSCHGRKRL